MHVTTVDQVVSKCWNKPNVKSRVAPPLGRLAIFALRDEVTRAIIVLFVGGHVANVEKNQQLTTNFPAHKNVEVWLFLQLL